MPSPSRPLRWQRVGLYLHVLPYYTQARTAMWQGLNDVFFPISLSQLVAEANIARHRTCQGGHTVWC